MITFKTIKFKHFRRAQELRKLIEAEEATDEDILRFGLDLVKSWDFKDEETGKPLPPGVESLDELSMPQCAEVNLLFAEEIQGKVPDVPKASA
jgi:hypothetical protein